MPGRARDLADETLLSCSLSNTLTLQFLCVPELLYPRCASMNLHSSPFAITIYNLYLTFRDLLIFICSLEVLKAAKQSHGRGGTWTHTSGTQVLSSRLWVTGIHFKESILYISATGLIYPCCIFQEGWVSKTDPPNRAPRCTSRVAQNVLQYFNTWDQAQNVEMQNYCSCGGWKWKANPGWN